MPKQTLILDSSQIATYLECPQLWHYSYIENISKIDAPPSDAISMGTYGHKLLDIFYKNVAEHGMAKSIEKAIAFDIDNETCECGHAKGEHSSLNEEYNDCIDCICQAFKPKPFPLDAAQRALVRDRFTIHCYTYSKNDFIPKSKDHVEVGFSYNLFEDDNKLYILEGRIDGLGSFSGQNAIIDHKFQLRRRDLYKKSIQFRNYSLVCNVPLIIINYIRLTQKIDKDTLSRQVASFSTLERQWWRGELIKIYDNILEGRNNPVKNYGACSGKFGYECQYTPLCEETNDDVRNVVKQNLYHPKEAWKPW